MSFLLCFYFVVVLGVGWEWVGSGGDRGGMGKVEGEGKKSSTTMFPTPLQIVVCS